MFSAQMKSVWRFIGITYLLTWLTWLPGFLSGYGLISEIPWLPFFALGTCGPLAAALFCFWREKGWAGVKQWLSAGFSRPVSWEVFFFLLLVPFFVPFLVWLVYSFSSGIFFELPVFHQPWMMIPSILLMVTIGGGQEEYGWRGYLLGKLEENLKPWQVNLFMILAHSLWHLPLFFIPYTLQFTYPFWVFLVFGAGFTLLANQLYHAARESLLAAVLFHGLVNAGLDTIPPVGESVGGEIWPLLLAGLLYFLLAIGFRLFRRQA